VESGAALTANPNWMMSGTPLTPEITTLWNGMPTVSQLETE
jgi:hypothetical protein